MPCIRKKTQIYITNVCDLHESMVHKRFLHNSHLKHSDIHVVPFRFDSANSKEHHETLLIETKHHIKESGVWMNIIHLCVKTGISHSSDLKMAAQQTTINPLGYLG
eukprot:1009088_1